MTNERKYSDPRQAMLRRFSGIVHALRKNNRGSYALSHSASEELSRNDHLSAQYTADMWEEFWRELESEYRHNLGLDGLEDAV